MHVDVKRVIHASLLFMLAWSCGGMGEPELTVTLSPSKVFGPEEVTVTVRATNGDGTIGTGTVKITSTAGSLSGGADVMLDAFGKASTALTCDPTTTPACASNVRVVAQWTPKGGGMPVSAEARLNSSSGSGGGGGTSGTGGGSGGGSGSGGQIIRTQCNPNNPIPGLPPSCCATNPSCGALVMEDGQRFSARMRTRDGGYEYTTLIAVAPPLPADGGTSCPGLHGLILASDGGIGEGKYRDGTISTTGFWTPGGYNDPYPTAVKVLDSACPALGATTIAATYVTYNVMSYTGVGMFVPDTVGGEPTEVTVIRRKK